MELCGHKQATAHAHVQPRFVCLNFEHTKNSNRSKKHLQRRKSNSNLLIKIPKTPKSFELVSCQCVRAPFTTHLVSDMLRACKQLVQTPAHMHARLAHWCCLFAFCECALLSCPALPCPALANFKWECVTRYCSRTRCRRSKGRSVLCLYCFICICFVHPAYS